MPTASPEFKSRFLGIFIEKYLVSLIDRYTSEKSLTPNSSLALKYTVWPSSQVAGRLIPMGLLSVRRKLLLR